MWAYSAFFCCLEDETTKSYAMLDSGVSTSVSEQNVDIIEVGILKKIYCVSFSGWSVVIMKADKVKQEMVHKEWMGFWTCKLDVRDDHRRINPFILPTTFFLEDVITQDWSIVLRHEPRSRRIIENTVGAFEYSEGHEILSHLERPIRDSVGRNLLERRSAIAREVHVARVAKLDANLTRTKDDSHYDDNKYEDEDKSNIRVI
ncbi:hypothetical protein M758_UG005100 [Ceratodon purpureus]|nr:hypothetical protein M758_UG005100 [Ceratodon purpureus]